MKDLLQSINASKECTAMKYDSKNCILTIEELSQCNKWTISDWINDHLLEVIEESGWRQSYRTGKPHIDIAVLYRGWLVAVYDLRADGCDEFSIQSIGYYSARNEA